MSRVLQASTREMYRGRGRAPRRPGNDALRWLSEARLELGKADAALKWLEQEAREVLGG